MFAGLTPVVLIRLDFGDTPLALIVQKSDSLTNVATVPRARHTAGDLQRLPSRSTSFQSSRQITPKLEFGGVTSMPVSHALVYLSTLPAIAFAGCQRGRHLWY